MSEGTVPGSEATPAAPVVQPVVEPVAATPAPVTPVVAENWRQQHLAASPDLLNNPTLEQIPDIATLAKNHVNVQKMIGVDKMPRPQEDWTPEQWAELHTTLGRPADANDYNLDALSIPEGLPWDEAFQGSMVAKMHELGMNQAQVEGMLGHYIGDVSGQFETQTAEAARATEQGMQNLRNEWGKSFDARADLSKRAFTAFAGDQADAVANIQLADGTALGDNPAFVKIFANAGDKMSEHGLIGGNASSRSTLSPAESDAKIKELYADEKFQAALFSKEHPEHDIAVKKMHDLTEAAHPNERQAG